MRELIVNRFPYFCVCNTDMHFCRIKNGKQILKFRMLLFILLLGACDMLADRELKLDGNLYLYCATGNGCWIAETYNNLPEAVRNANVYKVYKSGKQIYAKAHSGFLDSDTTYVAFYYDNHGYIHIDTLLNKVEFAKLTVGLEELISAIE